jgi:Mesyanzhinovviridae DNA helicase
MTPNAEFKFKTSPMKHQEEEWRNSRDLEFRAIHWEQGTGKTWLAINTAAWLRQRGQIGGMFVLAPNGVHQNWHKNELPAHMPGPYESYAYRTSGRGTKKQEAALTSLDKSPFPVLCMSYDSLMTKAGAEAAREFMEARRCLFVADEAQFIKTAGTKRTKRVIAAGKYAPYRRTLTGTPVTKCPFDVYPQMKFLSPVFWDRQGFASYEAYKSYFSVMRPMYNTHSGRMFDHVVGYQNVDRLSEMLAPHSSRVLKSEVLDLPPKVYTKRYFKLSDEQQAVYDQIKNDFAASLASGETITAPERIVQLLRLQQVTCGYAPIDSIDIDKASMLHFRENPRVEALFEAIAGLEGSTIIFARFRMDIDRICGVLEVQGDKFVRYDGRTPDSERSEAAEKFQAGEAKYFVGNPAACGRGLTLHKAQNVVYYSNSFDLEQRLQSEDRAHRIGQVNSVLYVDLVCEDTVDEHVVDKLRNKRNIASEVLGDEITEWI